MFGNRKRCPQPALQQLGMLKVTGDLEERSKIQKLKCPKGFRLTYLKTRSPSSSEFRRLGISDDVWVQEHVLTCNECNSEICVATARPGNLPAPSQSAVKSKPRADIYLVQHRLLPFALFHQPANLIGQLVESPVECGQAFLEAARNVSPTRSDTNNPLLHTERLDLLPDVETILITFSLPRAIGEGYFGMACFDRRKRNPQYFISERSVGLEPSESRHRAILGGWTPIGGNKNPDTHLNMGDLPDVSEETFTIAVKQRLEKAV